jgi:hypothetical protein
VRNEGESATTLAGMHCEARDRKKSGVTKMTRQDVGVRKGTAWLDSLRIKHGDDGMRRMTLTFEWLVEWLRLSRYAS